MDVRELLDLRTLKEGDFVKVTGWLVDGSDGLFLLGDHSPEDYLYPYRLKIANQNIIYAILSIIPSLGGGRSLLFYRAKARGFWAGDPTPMLTVMEIAIEGDRASDVFAEVNVAPEIINEFVRNNGDYKFDRPRNPMRDWLNDA